MMDRPGYLPLKQAAVWAGVSARTMKRWVAEGLPSYQAGHRTKVLIRPMDIDQFLTRRQVPRVNIDTLIDEVLHDLNHN
jgi:predicted site-specific integrase-resolvase